MSKQARQSSRNRQTTLTRPQYEVFLETARQLEADEEKSAADTLMGKLAKTPPDPKDKPKEKAGKR